jgi:hypothetical protein
MFSNKRFFWMQEPEKNKDKDKELIEKANEAINNPQAAESGLMGSGHEELLRLISSSGGIPNAQLQNLIQSQMRSSKSKSFKSFIYQLRILSTQINPWGLTVLFIFAKNI